MVANLLLILRLGMHDDGRDKRKEHIFEELKREDHLGPVMALLQNVEDIA